MCYGKRKQGPCFELPQKQHAGNEWKCQELMYISLNIASKSSSVVVPSLLPSSSMWSVWMTWQPWSQQNTSMSPMRSNSKLPCARLVWWCHIWWCHIWWCHMMMSHFHHQLGASCTSVNAYTVYTNMYTVFTLLTCYVMSSSHNKCTVSN